MTRRITAPPAPQTSHPRDWSGAFVERELGVTVHTDEARSIVPVDLLVGLALRRNPRRAHLLVSTVLAKHVPTDPGVVIAAGALLGVRVAEALGVAEPGIAAEFGARLTEVLGGEGGLESLRESLVGARVSNPALSVVGYAETATGLGRIVADTLGAPYLHSTRHTSTAARAWAAFEEEHSHATSHRLLPRRNDWFTASGTVVLVDDELSTGSTIVNTIRSLHALVPQRRFVVAALVDLRGAADRERFRALGDELGCAIDVVALGSGTVDLPADTLGAAARLLLRVDAATSPATSPAPAESDTSFARAPVSVVDLTPIEAIPSDRFGTIPGERPDVLTGAGAPEVVASLLGASCTDHAPGERIRTVHVLGTEEFIAFPLAVADRLAGGFADGDPGAVGDAPSIRVTFSTTTRSPIAVVARPDYAVESAVHFVKHDETLDDEPARHAYNLTRGGARFDQVILFPEPGTDLSLVTGAGSVTEALASVCDLVTVVLLASHDPLTETPMSDARSDA